LFTFASSALRMLAAGGCADNHLSVLEGASPPAYVGSSPPTHSSIANDFDGPAATGEIVKQPVITVRRPRGSIAIHP
jgi:hypothetical protein